VLLERCLTWEPDCRIESAAQLADDLDRYGQGRRITTKPLRLRYRLKRLAIGAAARSRWAFSSAIVAALGITLWATVFFFNVGWYSVAPMLPSPGPALPIGTDSSSIRDAILIAGVFDLTIPRVVDFAARNGIDGVTGDVRTWRAMHGEVMKRLATLRPKAVVWDYFFRLPDACDDRLLEGAATLEAAGVPVVFAVLTYGVDGVPNLSTNLRHSLGERLRHGSIAARDMVQRPGEFVLAIQSDTTVIPSLALSTVAAVLHPNAHVEIEWSDRSRRLGLLYRLDHGSYLRERDQIELARVFEAAYGDDPLHVGDLVGIGAFPLAWPTEWALRTIPYENLLLDPDHEIVNRVAGRVVMVGDFRESTAGFVADQHPVKHGMTIVERVPGIYLLADAITGLLGGRYMTSAFPPPPATFLVMLGLGAVGCLMPINLATRRVFHHRGPRRMVWALLLAAAALGYAGMVTTRNVVAVHAGMAAFSLLAPLAAALWVELARNRHRVLEDHRRAIDNLRLRMEGTLTLASKPATSP
jgi:hypothetical protein